MSTYRKALVALVGAMVMLAAAVSVAQAEVTRVSISRGGAISESSEGLMTFRESGGSAVECRIVLRGSFASGTLAVERQIGEITSATWESCRGGTLRSTLNFPWRMTLLGRLLYLTGITCNIVRDFNDPLATGANCGLLVLLGEMAIEVSLLEGLVRCLYVVEAASLPGILYSRNLITGAIIYNTWLLFGFRKNSGTCGETARLSGRLGALTPEQTMNFI